MNVQELIDTLKEFPPSLPVVYECHSEYDSLRKGYIEVRDLCMPRPDGWVHDKRPDKPSQKYVVLPGN